MYSRSRTPASQLEPELDPTTTPASAKTKTRRKSNADGLLPTKSGRVSMITNEAWLSVEITAWLSVEIKASTHTKQLENCKKCI